MEISYLKNTKDLIAYSNKRSQFRLNHFKKYINTRYSKISNGSLNNLIAYYKGVENESLVLESLQMELEYRKIIKNLNIVIKIQ